MDLPTRDRAPAHVAPVPAGQPGVPVAGPERSKAARFGQPVLAALIALAVAAPAWHFDSPPRLDALQALPDTLRVFGAVVLLFGVTGFGVVRLMLPEALRRYELFWILPAGGCATGLAMTVLGFAAVPYAASLP